MSLGFKSAWKSVLFSDLTQPIVLKTRADPWRFLLKRKKDLSSQPLFLVITLLHLSSYLCSLSSM